MRPQKVTIAKQGDYIVGCPQAPLNDSEFSQFSEILVKKVSDEKVKGVLIDLQNMDVIDSFATRILHDVAQSTKKRGIPTVLCNIHSDVNKTMRMQGLNLAEIKQATDLIKGLHLLSKS